MATTILRRCHSVLFRQLHTPPPFVYSPLQLKKQHILNMGFRTHLTMSTEIKAAQDDMPSPPLPKIPYEHTVPVNRVQLTGTVSADVEDVETPHGLIARFPLMVSSTLPSGPHTDRFQIDIMDILACAANEQVKSGMHVHVKGTMTFSQDTGAPVMTVHADEIMFIEGEPGDGGSSLPKQQPSLVKVFPDREQELWGLLNQDSNMFWDNRKNKRNPRAPDFVNKDTREPLWLTSRNAPSWALDALGGGDMQQVERSVTPQAPSMAQSSLGRMTTEREAELWKEVQFNMSAFWDNRVNKKNPKGPDFVHKETREALWLNSRNAPNIE